VIAALLAGGCAGVPEWGSITEAAGERQRVLCRGAAGPAVVLVHGIGDRAGSASFAEVVDRLPADRRVCRYDRPGAGDSPKPDRPARSAGQLDAELDSVVRQADANQPVVLVGHSFGSYPVLHYTARHRDRVAGVVLADGVDPEFGLLRALGVSTYPDVAMAGEKLDLPAVQEQTALAVTGGLGDVPLTVVRRDKNATPAWVAAQERLTGLSSRARLVVAAGAGHEIPNDNPDAVADAITALT
jgi:pimeloyl-ACP methyl ester carboxylesterase